MPIKEIVLAEPRGFCAGVNYAIDIVNQAYQHFQGEYSIYILNEIVHNKTIVQEYQNQGIKSVKSIEEVPKGSIIIFSAHGVPPEFHTIARERGLYVIDATCPLVRKVHLEAIRFAKEGYYILYVGHKGHEEAIGVLAECPESIVLIDTIEDAENVSPPQKEKLAYLTQTTLSVDQTAEIINILERRFPGIQGPAKEDICYATTNRQKAVKELAKAVDLVLVIGSQNSSNSQRLKEAAQKHGSQSYLIDSYQQIKDEWLEGIETVGITAGASAPEKAINAVIEYLREKNHEVPVKSLSVVQENITFALPNLQSEINKQIEIN